MVPTIPPEVREIADRVVQSYDPERVILFGSRAEGGAREDSDVDLLIVKDTPERPLERARHVRRAFRNHPRTLGLDVIVLTPRELEAALREGHSFVTRALQRGVVLYAK